MTLAEMTKSISYQTDVNGNKTAIVLDLKNKAVQELMEDIFDLLKVKDRLDDERVDFFEATDLILANKKK